MVVRQGATGGITPVYAVRTSSARNFALSDNEQLPRTRILPSSAGRFELDNKRAHQDLAINSDWTARDGSSSTHRLRALISVRA